LCIAFIVGWRLSAYPRGMLMAYGDHACGDLEIKGYGEPPPSWWGAYCDLLEERYNVKDRMVGGCVVSWELRNYVAGYNEVSKPLIEKRFGKGIFKECAAEARAAWERENGNEK
jgi:hypothetical protein